MRLLEVLTGLLYPPKCPFCGRVLAGGREGICPRCVSSLPRTAAGDVKTVSGCRRCLAPLWYRDGAVEAVHRYKFLGGQEHAALLGSLMAECLAERWEEPLDAVTWAPLHVRRLRERGYDQAGLLALEVGTRLGLRVVPLLEKVRDAPPQSGLEEERDRRANVRGAYRVREGAVCAGLRLVLVDDVITTGATLSECAGALMEAGAASVVGLGLAWARK